MRERILQSEVDRLFNEMFSSRFQLTAEDRLDPDWPTFGEFFRHLKDQGYSDDEITTIFDLGIEGDKYEV